MKRSRPPFARRSVWTAIAIIALIVVVGGAVAGYQLHQLQNDINGLNQQLTSLNHILQPKAK